MILLNTLNLAHLNHGFNSLTLHSMHGFKDLKYGIGMPSHGFLYNLGIIALTNRHKLLLFMQTVKIVVTHANCTGMYVLV